MATITEDLMIADKPTLDEVLAMLKNSGYGLNALKTEETTIENLLKDSSYGLSALKTLIGSNSGGSSGGGFKEAHYSHVAPSGNTMGSLMISGKGVALIKSQVVTSRTTAGDQMLSLTNAPQVDSVYQNNGFPITYHQYLGASNGWYATREHQAALVFFNSFIRMWACYTSSSSEVTIESIDCWYALY